MESRGHGIYGWITSPFFFSVLRGVSIASSCDRRSIMMVVDSALVDYQHFELLDFYFSLVTIPRY